MRQWLHNDHCSDPKQNMGLTKAIGCLENLADVKKEIEKYDYKWQQKTILLSKSMEHHIMQVHVTVEDKDEQILAELRHIRPLDPWSASADQE